MQPITAQVVRATSKYMQHSGLTQERLSGAGWAAQQHPRGGLGVQTGIPEKECVLPCESTQPTMLLLMH